MKQRITTILLILFFLAGLSLLLYPTVSNAWNAHHSSKAIVAYDEEIDKMSEEDRRALFDAAVAYNNEMASRMGQSYKLSEENRARYESLLNIGGDGMMGYIEIESLDVRLPIYHGTSPGVLQRGVGHMDWTSLPAGGTSSHCVLSGHRGLPSAKLFTHLDKLVAGDTFTLHIIDEILTYEVDQIRIVEPKQTDDLLIEEGRDYCTLVTCTPYGINTHRLLVRGHRIPTEDKGNRVVGNAMVIDPMIVSPIVAIPMLLALLIAVLVKNPRKKKQKGEKTKKQKE